MKLAGVAYMSLTRAEIVVQNGFMRRARWDHGGGLARRRGNGSPHHGATKQPGCGLPMRPLVQGGLGASHSGAMQQYDVLKYSSYLPGKLVLGGLSCATCLACRERRRKARQQAGRIANINIGCNRYDLTRGSCGQSVHFWTLGARDGWIASGRASELGSTTISRQLRRPYLHRSVWIGGHGTVPYEQKTQQSPGFGFSRVPHALQS